MSIQTSVRPFIAGAAGVASLYGLARLLLSFRKTPTNSNTPQPIGRSPNSPELTVIPNKKSLEKISEIRELIATSGLSKEVLLKIRDTQVELLIEDFTLTLAESRKIRKKYVTDLMEYDRELIKFEKEMIALWEASFQFICAKLRLDPQEVRQFDEKFTGDTKLQKRVLTQLYAARSLDNVSKETLEKIIDYMIAEIEKLPEKNFQRANSLDTARAKLEFAADLAFFKFNQDPLKALANKDLTKEPELKRKIEKLAILLGIDRDNL